MALLRLEDSEIDWSEGQTKLPTKGSSRNLFSELQQISYSGRYAAELGQEVLFVTERAVFQRGPDGVELIEIAPGIDLHKDMLS